MNGAFARRVSDVGHMRMETVGILRWTGGAEDELSFETPREGTRPTSSAREDTLL